MTLSAISPRLVTPVLALAADAALGPGRRQADRRPFHAHATAVVVPAVLARQLMTAL
jgi:hypothetical protein